MVQLVAPLGPVQTARAQPAELYMGFLEAVDSLNPFRGINDPSYELYGMIYDYLYSLDEDGNLVPSLAVNAYPDTAGFNWTYWIRQGVKWHDGTDFTANDVAFTINYNIQNFFQLWAFEPYVNRIIQCNAQTRPYCGAAVTSPWNVTVYFDRPFVPGRGIFIPIIQEAQWSKVSASQAQYGFDNPNPIGTGPFIADQNIYTQFLSGGGQPLILHKNPFYYPVGNHTGPAKLDTIYFQQFNDENTLVNALKAGQVDLAKLTSSGYDAIVGEPNIAKQQALLSTQYETELGFTQLDEPNVNGRLNPTRYDRDVRRALALATNKDYIINTFYGGRGARGDSLVSTITPEWHYDPIADGANLTFNVQAANALLNQSGYTDWTGGSFGQGYRTLAADKDVYVETNAAPGGKYITIPAGTMIAFTMAIRQEFTAEQDTGTYLVAQWAKVGVQVTTKVELESALSNDVYGGQVETYIWYWSADPDPNYILSVESGFTLDGWNDNYYNNATYNRLYVEHLAAFDFTTRQQLAREAQKQHYEDAVYIIFVYNFGHYAYRTDELKNWGDWAAHPYRQMDAFWGSNPLFLELEPITQQQNTCPTKPVIVGSPPLTAYTGINVTFTGQSADPDSGQTLTWNWDWDDGNNTFHQTSTLVSSDSADHNWSQAATYQVTLSVTDGTCSRTSDPFQVDVQVVTGPVGWIVGTVKDSITNQPVRTANIAISPIGAGGAVDPAGAYNITVPEGDYEVTASDALHISQMKPATVTGNAETTVDFLLLPNVGWIAGSVRTTGNAPIVNASVLVFRAGFSVVARTNTLGTYNVTVSPGTYTVNATASGYVGKSTQSVAVTLGTTTTVDFQLEAIQPPPSGLSPLVLAGIGIVIAVAAIAVVAFLLTRRRKKKEEETRLEIPKQ